MEPLPQKRMPRPRLSGIDPAALSESAKVAKVGGAQPAAGDALTGGYPENLEQPVPAAEAPVEGGEAMPAADPEAGNQGTNAAEAIPISVESAGVDAEQRVDEAANELGNGDTTPAEGKTESNVSITGSAGSLESAHEMEPGGIHATVGTMRSSTLFERLSLSSLPRLPKPWCSCVGSRSWCRYRRGECWRGNPLVCRVSGSIGRAGGCWGSERAGE